MVALRFLAENRVFSVPLFLVLVVMPVVPHLQLDRLGIVRAALQQPPDLLFRFRHPADRRQPVAAFRHEEAAHKDNDARNDGAGIHQPPGAHVRHERQDQVADGGAGEGADRLEGEGRQNEASAGGTGNALRDHQMGGRVVASEREADAEQEHHHPRKGGRDRKQDQEEDEDHHFDDEHQLPPEMVGQSAKGQCAHQECRTGWPPQRARARRRPCRIPRS